MLYAANMERDVPWELQPITCADAFARCRQEYDDKRACMVHCQRLCAQFARYLPHLALA